MNVRSFILIFFLSFWTLISSCSPAEDDSYLTPIPETTLNAYRTNMTIENKVQAVVAAQAYIRTTRIDFIDRPNVVSVEEMQLEEANKFLHPASDGGYYEDRPGDTKVWLVLLTGNWRIIPPDFDHSYTPRPFRRGCAYILVDEDGAGTLRTTACPE